MAGQLPSTAPVAKGWIPYCLEEMSKKGDSGAGLRRLYNALRDCRPQFDGLADLFGKYLLANFIESAPKIERIVDHLDHHWFGDGRELFFPDEPVAQIYGTGVLHTLELSLAGNREPIPIQSWWIPDFPSVKLLTLAQTDLDRTVTGPQVTLLILTPRPQGEGRGTYILRPESEVWLAEKIEGKIEGRRIAHSA